MKKDKIQLVVGILLMYLVVAVRPLKLHLYTRDENEKNVLRNRGWNYEGVAWTVLK